MKKIILIVVIAIVVVGGLVLLSMKNSKTSEPVADPSQEVNSKIVYTNASAEMISVDTPRPDDVTGKEFTVIGKAIGPWYSEATFPVQVVAKDGTVLFSGGAEAQGDWMTENQVPFFVNVTIPETFIGEATIVLKKDNPSGLPERDASISYPITIEY